MPEAACLAEECVYAKGYYDRVHGAVEDMFGEEAWTRQVIEKYASKDLVGDRLCGAIVVGVGLPQIGLEREIIHSYYETTSRQGHEFAYMYPGFNKVLQAVGRVIRTEEDRGIVLLIDERFSLRSYQQLLPEEWQKGRFTANADCISKAIGSFWA